MNYARTYLHHHIAILVTACMMCAAAPAYADFRISGYVRDHTNAYIGAVTVVADNGGTSFTTSADGYYEVTVPDGWSGTVTPTKAGVVFDPYCRKYSAIAADVPDQRFSTRVFVDSGIALPQLARGGLAWGDYDNDGDLDLAAAGWVGSDRTAKIYRNDGGTAFTDIGVSGMYGVNWAAVAWGDYDADGKLDLVVAGEYSGLDSTYLYHNDGGDHFSFQPPDTFYGTRLGGLAWGDVDNDGDLDLATAGTSCSLYTQDKGVFTHRNGHGSGTAAVAMGDYYNNGMLCTFTVGFTSSGYPSAAIRKYNGTSFDTTFYEGLTSPSAAVADYDNDGDLDLVYTGAQATYPYLKLKLILKKSNGAGWLIDTPTNLPALYRCSIAWGDYDNDGDPDLAMAGSNDSTKIARIYRNDGDEVFTDIGAGLTGVENCSLTWVDIDQDGDLDLALAGDTGAGFVTRIYRNDGTWRNRHPAAPTGLSTTGTSTASAGTEVTFSWLAASDAETPSNGLSYNLRVGTAPGKDDVFSGMSDISTGQRKVIGLGNAQKKLSWTIKRLDYGRTYYWGVQAVDGNYVGSPWAEGTVTAPGVGISGHVWTSSGKPVEGVKISAYVSPYVVNILTDSEGYYFLGVPSGWSGSVSIGKSGWAFQPERVSYSNLTENQNQDVIGWMMFERMPYLTDLSASRAAWGDYDSDGDLDLAVAGAYGSDRLLKVYRNDGTGGLTSSGISLPAGTDGGLAWGDYDNDGDLDIAVAGTVTTSTCLTRIYRNTGDSFTLAADLTPFAHCSLAWGDYDNDGDLDLAIAGASSPATTYVRMTKIFRNDDGTFADSGITLEGLRFAAVGWADYDKDGDLDLAIAGEAAPGPLTRLYRNDGGGSFSDSRNVLAGVKGASLAWGDYDNNGYPDLAVSGIEASGYYDTDVYGNTAGVLARRCGMMGVVGTLAFGDYDNDGWLDLALCGYDSSGSQTELYRNTRDGLYTFTGAGFDKENGGIAFGDCDGDGNLDVVVAGPSKTTIYRNLTSVVNVAPTAPADMCASQSGGDIVVSWGAASDAQTPVAGLCYNLRVGTSEGADDVFSGMARLDGKRKLPWTGNAQQNLSWTLKNLPEATYYLSVQAVDTSFAGSAWADEKFTPDFAPPTITGVTLTPTKAASGDPIAVAVSVTDNTAVASVTANGAPLRHDGGDIWSGSIPALTIPGSHAVTITAKDPAENTSEAGSTYETLKVLRMIGRDTAYPATALATGRYLFKFWGSISDLDANGFLLDDGSGTQVRVIAPGYAGLIDGDHVSARGALDTTTTPATLTSSPAWVVEQ